MTLHQGTDADIATLNFAVFVFLAYRRSLRAKTYETPRRIVLETRVPTRSWHGGSFVVLSFLFLINKWNDTL